MYLRGLPRKRDVMRGHIYTNPLLCASAPWKQQQVNRLTEFIELNKQVILQLAQLTSCALSGNRKFTFVT